jgi:hypothetical protein
MTPVGQTFEPRLEVLPPAQRALWPDLVSLPPGFVLYGGTALALQLGHRTSIDFDFFGFDHFDPDELQSAVPWLEGATTLQKAASTLTCQVDRGGWVMVSFFGVPNLGRIEPPLATGDTGLPVAGLLDLAGTKAAVVQKRAEAKDYIDLDALFSAGVSLSTALAAAGRLYGPSFNPEISLKALSWFGDGNLTDLPQTTRARIAEAVRTVDLDALPDLP